MFKQGLPSRFKEPKGWLWGEFTGARGEPLRFGTLRSHKTPLAHVVYIEGLSEFAEKTFELARDFNRMACNFSVLDRHGQGKSARYFGSNDKQHSDGLDADVEDIIKYCREHIPPGEPIVLLGHSTGALFALLALEKAPDLFKAAILTAPLLGFENPFVKNLEGFYANICFPQWLRQNYAGGGGPWKSRDSDESSLKPEDFSSDPVRNKVSDYWPQHDPALQAGSATVGWVHEMCKAVIKVRDPAFLQRITMPMLIFTAGDDALVTEKPAHDAAQHMKKATCFRYEHGKHELLMETDTIRKDLLSRVRDFLKKNL